MLADFNKQRKEVGGRWWSNPTGVDDSLESLGSSLLDLKQMWKNSVWTNTVSNTEMSHQVKYL